MPLPKPMPPLLPQPDRAKSRTVIPTNFKGFLFFIRISPEPDISVLVPDSGGRDKGI
jgi:hypothetical protein